jgi:uncharacterized protein YebE (UPF0316 family)
MIKLLIQNLGIWIYLLIIIAQILINILYTIMVYFLSKNNKKFVLFSCILYSSVNYICSCFWFENWQDPKFFFFDMIGASIGMMIGMILNDQIEKKIKNGEEK